MDKDRIKGTLKVVAGKVIGSDEQQRKSIEKQVDGQTRKALGDIDASNKQARPQPGLSPGLR